MINTVVVGYGLAGRWIHAPLILRQPALRLVGVVARSAEGRSLATELGVTIHSTLEQVLEDPSIQLVVIATPHDTHATLVTRTLGAGKDCVVDKVMCLATAEADLMINARDRSGRMLSVFHNRRWDWDYLTIKHVLEQGTLGTPWRIESSVCRWSAPRTWRGSRETSGTILHDWGAHLIDQVLNLGFGCCREIRAEIQPAPWPGVDSGGHGWVSMRFERGVHAHIEVSRICPFERPRWFVLGSRGGLVKWGIDPQEQALRLGDLDGATEPGDHHARVRRLTGDEMIEETVATIRGSWDSYYQNIADVLLRARPLLVTAEDAREVVRVLESVTESADTGRAVEGCWGSALG